MSVSDEHPLKTPKQISVTLFGIVIFVRLQQSLKAPKQIFVTLFGIVIFVSDTHPLKAIGPIFVTLFGISIFVSDEHSENVFFEIAFTPSRIVISEIFLKTEKIPLKFFTATSIKSISTN